MTRFLLLFMLTSLFLVSALAASGCSDTECHDKLAASGGLEQSRLCELAGLDGGTVPVDTADTGFDPDLSAPPDSELEGDVPVGEDVTTPDVVEEVAENENALLGGWVSLGDDLAPLLRNGGFEIASVSVTFDGDGTYRGVIALAGGDELPYGGTFEVDDARSPWVIQLHQTAPQALVSAGLVEVAGDTMRLEVVQIDPPTAGFQPPVGQFGTTQGIDNPNDNIQIYRRQ
jgi:hypothetical protein